MVAVLFDEGSFARSNVALIAFLSAGVLLASIYGHIVELRFNYNCKVLYGGSLFEDQGYLTKSTSPKLRSPD